MENSISYQLGLSVFDNYQNKNKHGWVLEKIQAIFRNCKSKTYDNIHAFCIYDLLYAKMMRI